MNTDTVHDRVTQFISQSTTKKYHFSFNFGSIRKDTKQFNNNSSKWKRAIIIEAKRKEKDQIYKIMGKIYS